MLVPFSVGFTSGDFRVDHNFYFHFRNKQAIESILNIRLLQGEIEGCALKCVTCYVCEYMFLSFRMKTIEIACLPSLICGRRAGLMVGALVPGSSGPGSSPGREKLYCVLGQDTLLSQCLPPPRSINGYRRIVGET